MDKIEALAKFLQVPTRYIEQIDDNTFNIVDNREEYLVVTDAEADELWEEGIENYLDECVLPEIPDNLQIYFDEDKWKDDAKIDGRAHVLARYDGKEYEIDEYYIYRIN